MRFELFDRARSVGVVTFRSGELRLLVHDPEERRFLTRYFSGEARDEGEEFVFEHPDLSPVDFERVCLALRELRGFAVAARPATPG